MEKWKDIPGWEGLYTVSTYGRVRSYDRIVGAAHNSTALRKGRILTPVKLSNKYLGVTLADEQVRKQIMIHNLVLLTFRGPKPKGHHARHLDCNSSNNKLSNLKYGTPTTNALDSIRNGKTARGIKHGMAKLTESQVVAIRSSSADREYLGEKYGIHPGHVYHVQNRNVWKHIK